MRSEARLLRSAGKSSMKILLLPVFVALCLPSVSLGQWSSPPAFSLVPASLTEGECYTIRVPNWPNAVLNVGYTTSWTGQQFIYGWPSLSQTGDAYICTGAATQTGTYIFNWVSNTYYGQWWSINASVTVNPAQLQQPTSLSFNPTSGYAGIVCYTMTVGNGKNMTVDINYSLSNFTLSTWTGTMNSSGQWQYCVNHHDQPGSYSFYEIKNHLSSGWVPLSPPSTFSVQPPQPTSLQITPPTIVQGTAYQIFSDNAAAVTLDVQYTFNDGPVQTIIGWPTLLPTDGNYSPSGSPTGYVTVGTGSATALGKYAFTAIKNTLNTDWVPTSASVTVCPNAAPTISSIVPNLVPQGGSTLFTITGANLCAVSLQSLTNAALSFSDVAWSFPLTTVTATANATNYAALGPAQIRLTTPAGSVTTQFTVSPPGVLTREYIYLGNRVISTVSP